jgi:hypothetical protein
VSIIFEQHDQSDTNVWLVINYKYARRLASSNVRNCHPGSASIWILRGKNHPEWMGLVCIQWRNIRTFTSQLSPYFDAVATH